MDVPGPVREKARQAGAARWLDRLDSLIAGLERDWSITVGRRYPTATEALVAEAETRSGDPVVLKLLIPRDDDTARNEATVLRLAGGAGCVRLLREDLDRGALLLERLGPSLSDLGLPMAERHAILCDVAAALWRPAPGADLPSGAQKGASLIEYMLQAWGRLREPCAPATVEHALACARRRIDAHDPARAVLVHGDVHQWNALRAGPGYTLIDPDGLLAEPECDLGVLMREDPAEILDGDPRARARALAARTGLDPVAIWEWGVLERVSTGLLLTAIDLQPTGRLMLAAADLIARDFPDPP